MDENVNQTSQSTLNCSSVRHSPKADSFIEPSLDFNGFMLGKKDEPISCLVDTRHVAEHSTQINDQALPQSIIDPLQKSPGPENALLFDIDDANACPYREGSVLTITNTSNEVTNVLITHVFRPFTLSCVMKVQIMNDQDKPEAVLKLYDRRFAVQLRDEWGVHSWDNAYEESYTTLISSDDDVAGFRKSLHDLSTGSIVDIRCLDESSHLDPDSWSLGQDECYLGELCRQAHNTELQAYNRLSDLQGTSVPRLISDVAMTIHYLPPVDRELVEIPGLLLEFVPGVTLREMPYHIPMSSWQLVADLAVSAINTISDHHVLNFDVRPANVLASPCPASASGYRIVVIDFGITRLRAPNENDETWGREKSLQDEEGKIGYSLRKILRDHNYQLSYIPSERYDAWAIFEVPRILYPRSS